MKRWSKLQKRIYNLIDPQLKLQIHCVAYPMRSQRGSTSIPRYYITLNKEIIWDYPKDFITLTSIDTDTTGYPNTNDISSITALIDEYIETPKEDLYDKTFENDKWELTNILKSADRRIGTRRLDELKNNASNAVLKIITQRKGNNE